MQKRIVVGMLAMTALVHACSKRSIKQRAQVQNICHRVLYVSSGEEAPRQRAGDRWL